LINENSLNRVDVEAAVFQPESMEYLTGEYEAFLYDGEVSGEAILRVSMECYDRDHCDKKLIEDRFIDRFLKNKPGLVHHYHEGNFPILFNFTGPGGLELHKLRGRPKRLVDRREH
jgi:hypothetical protein